MFCSDFRAIYRAVDYDEPQDPARRSVTRFCFQFARFTKRSTSGARTLNDDEEQLIDQATQGDRKAFECLVRQHQNLIYHAIRPIAGCHAEAEDVVQETFIQVFQKLDSFRKGSKFYTWVYRISVNIAISRKRRKRPTVSVDSVRESGGGEPADEQNSPGSQLEREERQRAVRNALQELSGEHQTIIQLREMEGKSYEEISGELKITVGTVRSRLHRARAQLEQQLIKSGADQLLID